MYRQTNPASFLLEAFASDENAFKPLCDGPTRIDDAASLLLNAKLLIVLLYCLLNASSTFVQYAISIILENPVAGITGRL